VIGRLKADRFHLKGESGNQVHAVLCAAGYNLRRLLRVIAGEDLGPFLLFAASALLGNQSTLGQIIPTYQRRMSW